MDKKFKVYVEEVKSRKKIDKEGYTIERIRMIKYIPTKRIFWLNTKRKNNDYKYQISEEADLDGAILTLNSTKGVLVCKSMWDYLNQVCDVVLGFIKIKNNKD